MVLSRGEAYEILELPIGADPDSICTSYKRLAMKWHPEKHTNAPEATKKFHRVSLAYKRLTTDNENVQLNINQTFELFQQTFFPKNNTPYSNGYYSSDDETTSDEDDDDDEVDYLSMFTDHLRSKQDNRKNKNDIGSKRLSPEEIEKNANELISEEEKEKRKAEKRRAKKKRRRDKKRAEKQAADEEKKNGDDKKRSGKVKDGIPDDKNKKKDKKNRGGSSGSEAEEFDTNAAFFTQVVNKKKKSSGATDTPVTTNKSKPVDGKEKGKTDEESEDLDPIVLRSRQLAIRGNEMANLGHYSAAIDLFSEAIKLDPRDFRFFGNRSYCFDRMSQHERALKDADKAVHLAPDWPKGYFRKGRALAGLKLYAEAEQAFMQVLKLDRNCEDAMAELLRVRTHQLTEMGFSRNQAEQAIRQYDTVQQALDSLLTGVGKLDLMAESSLASEVYVSDEEDYVTTTKATSPQISPAVPVVSSHQVSDFKQESSRSGFGPANPEGLTALWVGNVLPEVTDKKLTQMFSKFGTVTSVRCLPDKYCAFVNFKNKEAAGRAMNGLQGVECAGQRLLIKFPDNPICNGNVIAKKGSNPQPTTSTNSKRQTSASKTVPKPTPTASTKTVVVAAAAAAAAAAVVAPAPALTNGISAAAAAANASVQKLTGPVNGDECYFWRTTGCQFGKNCHYRHLPEHKGIDRKPWQRVK